MEGAGLNELQLQFCSPFFNRVEFLSETAAGARQLQSCRTCHWLCAWSSRAVLQLPHPVKFRLLQTCRVAPPSYPLLPTLAMAVLALLTAAGPTVAPGLRASSLLGSAGPHCGCVSKGQGNT